MAKQLTSEEVNRMFPKRMTLSQQISYMLGHVVVWMLAAAVTLGLASAIVACLRYLF
jgi:hypothetical protein